MRSREEDDELQRSTKKVKENHSVVLLANLMVQKEGPGLIKTSLSEKYQELMSKPLASRA